MRGKGAGQHTFDAADREIPGEAKNSYEECEEACQKGEAECMLLVFRERAALRARERS